MPAISPLIKKIASHPSTEELILFIAGNEEMVKACLELQNRLDKRNDQDLAALDAECRNHQISLDMLALEVRRILAIFASGEIIIYFYPVRKIKT